MPITLNVGLQPHQITWLPHNVTVNGMLHFDQSGAPILQVPIDVACNITHGNGVAVYTFHEDFRASPFIIRQSLQTTNVEWLESMAMDVAISANLPQDATAGRTVVDDGRDTGVAFTVANYAGNTCSGSPTNYPTNQTTFTNFRTTGDATCTNLSPTQSIQYEHCAMEESGAALNPPRYRATLYYTAGDCTGASFQQDYPADNSCVDTGVGVSLRFSCTRPSAGGLFSVASTWDYGTGRIAANGAVDARTFSPTTTTPGSVHLSGSITPTNVGSSLLGIPFEHPLAGDAIVSYSSTTFPIDVNATASYGGDARIVYIFHEDFTTSPFVLRQSLTPTNIAWLDRMGMDIGMNVGGS